jgi:NhaP-type Na+/H+ or K+/H+ antiporter
MHHGPEFLIIQVICFILIIGAAVRMLTKYFKLPYTIVIMLVGMAVGYTLDHSGQSQEGVLNALAHPETVSPDLIIFIFLPILIFESAYSLEVHSFQRSLGTVMVLAVPVLLVATAVTGFAMYFLTTANWQWSLLSCLIFGSLISATDPVAVVALLKDLGAPKRLGLLIEGESLLNDGTAIVVFSLLLTFYEPGTEFHLLAAIGKFLKVAGGGFVVGLILARSLSFWLSKTFNAPLIEITLMVALAYSCMIVAEGFLHVSGVIAVVTAGLWMKGPGKTHISPEVHHFLHQWLEVVAHIANTVIFFLVGIVVAVQLVPILATDARWTYLYLVSATFGGIVVIRLLLLHCFRPVMNLVGDRVSTQEVNVMSWGGLRGAVSLALALIVSQDTNIPQELRSQILLLAAGVVLLTILVNGSTMGFVLGKLGFNETPPGDRLAELVTHSVVLDQVSQKLIEVSKSRDLRTVDWRSVSTQLEERREKIHQLVEGTQVELEEAGPSEKNRGVWRKVLSIERDAYWSAFAGGTLGGAAAQTLDHEIDLEIDRLNAGEVRPLLANRGAMIPAWRLELASFTERFFMSRRGHFNILSLRFDLCRAATLASEHVLEEVEKMNELAEDVRGAIKKAYKEYHNRNKERLEDIRANLPELANAIETQLAQRIQLNFEREQYLHLSHHGVLEAGVASQALGEIELRMKQLARARNLPQLPSLKDLIERSPLFSGLESKTLDDLSALASEKIFSRNETIFKQGDAGDSMIIVARGAVGVFMEMDGVEVHIDTFGGGDILGEMSLIVDQVRNATLRAVTTVTTGSISRSGFMNLMASQPELRVLIWRRFAERSFDNYLRSLPRYKYLSHRNRLGWFHKGEEIELEAGAALTSRDVGLFFLAIGELRGPGREFAAPMLIRADSFESLTSVEQAWIVFLPFDF